MQITNRDQIDGRYAHIFLSPHLDDAALSCGGAIARHDADGARVLVVTLCTALPDSSTPFSSFAAATHATWKLAPEEAVSARLREDELAMERLGADFYWADFSDAIYRMPDVYINNESLFGTPAPNDPLGPELVALLVDLRRRAPNATFYAPLGIGNHVDHQLVCAAALIDANGTTTALYEDVPYVLREGALDQRFGALGGRFVPSTIDIDDGLSRKIGAIEAYTSQVDDLFGSTAEMHQAIIAYAEQMRPDEGTYGERIWLRATPALQAKS